MLETELTPNSKTWNSGVESPEVIENPSVYQWSDEADLIVIGLGGAGVSAANEALDQNLSVIAIDKTTGGGATARSGGVFYAGGGTPIQKEANISDSPDNMYRYLKQEVGNVVKDETLRKFCDTSPANTQWLMDNGVKFNSSYYQTKTSYPDAGYYLYHSDNSLVPKYMETAEPAARGHRGWEDGPFKPIGVGGTIYYPLKKSALSKGLRMYSQSEVKSLLINPQGNVIGCKVMVMPSGSVSEKHKKLIRRGELFQMILPPSYPGSSFFQKIGQKFINKAQKLEKKYREAKYFKAKKGVCISAGGFIFNRAMVEEYAPKYSKGMPLGTSQDNGSGIRLGQSVGGRTKHMDRVTAWRFLNPPMSFAKGMVVNKNGRRFCNEMVYGATLGDEMCENNNGKAYLILSEELFKSSKLEAAKSLPFQRDAAKMLMTFNAVKRKNINDLAKVYGINEDNLKESIHQYNQSVINDDHCFLGKASKDMKKIDGPYYIMDISIDSRLSPLPTLTLGGLEVDEATGNVINTQGEAIKGLFAAGRSAVGVCSNIYVSGLSIADCVFSGRRVGKSLGEII